MDLVLELRGRLVPIEVKLGTVPRVERGLIECMKDLELRRGFVAYGGQASYPPAKGIWAIPATALAMPRQLVSLLRETGELLATVVGQDLEQREDGVFRIARRVAEDRVISTVGPEAGHGHETAARGGGRLQGTHRDRP